MCWMNVFILQLLEATFLSIVLRETDGIPLPRSQGVELRTFLERRSDDNAPLSNRHAPFQYKSVQLSPHRAPSEDDHTPLSDSGTHPSTHPSPNVDIPLADSGTHPSPDLDVSFSSLDGAYLFPESVSPQLIQIQCFGAESQRFLSIAPVSPSLTSWSALSQPSSQSSHSVPQSTSNQSSRSSNNQSPRSSGSLSSQSSNNHSSRSSSNQSPRSSDNLPPRFPHRRPLTSFGPESPSSELPTSSGVTLSANSLRLWASAGKKLDLQPLPSSCIQKRAFNKRVSLNVATTVVGHASAVVGNLMEGENRTAPSVIQSQQSIMKSPAVESKTAATGNLSSTTEDLTSTTTGNLSSSSAFWIHFTPECGFKSKRSAESSEDYEVLFQARNGKLANEFENAFQDDTRLDKTDAGQNIRLGREIVSGKDSPPSTLETLHTPTTTRFYPIASSDEESLTEAGRSFDSSSSSDSTLSKSEQTLSFFRVRCSFDSSGNSKIKVKKELKSRKWIRTKAMESFKAEKAVKSGRPTKSKRHVDIKDTPKQHVKDEDMPKRHVDVEDMRRNLDVTLHRGGPFPIFENDLMTLSVEEQFQDLAQRSRKIVDEDKANFFLRNVLHAVDMAVSDYGRGRTLDLRNASLSGHRFRRHSASESMPHERKLLVALGVTLAALLLITILLIVAVASDRIGTRSGSGTRRDAAHTGGTGGRSSWLCVRLCPRTFHTRKQNSNDVKMKKKKTAAANRPLPAIPLPHAETGRIELPPAIMVETAVRSGFVEELHV